MTRIRVLLLIAFVVATVSVANAQQRLVLKDGRKIEGAVKEVEAGYQITQPNGLVAVFLKDSVLRVEEVVTLADEFKKRYAKAGKNPEKLYEAAVWARENKLLHQARLCLKKAIKIKGDYEDAQLRLRLIEAEIKAATKPVDPSTNGGTTKPSETTVIKPGLANLLTMEDIYRIRLLELSSRESLPIEYRNDMLKRFVEARLGPQFQKAGGERAFLRWKRPRQVRYILNETSRRSGDYRDDIIIKADPLVMKYFRAKVWPILRVGCASLHCHGGAKGAGKLKLFTGPQSDDRVAYTNYYILHEWKLGDRRIINLDAPQNSLLLEFGLPSDVAKPSLVHPKKRRKPPFASRRDPDFRKIERWIDKLERPMLPPGYRVDYRIPLLDDARKPVAPEDGPKPSGGEDIPGPND